MSQTGRRDLREMLVGNATIPFSGKVRKGNRLFFDAQFPLESSAENGISSLGDRRHGYEIMNFVKERILLWAHFDLLRC